MSLEAGSAAWNELRAVARGLDPDLAVKIAAEWARDAQFEHASIASFGRFALELLAVGAPSELVESAHRAAIDEIEHARLCFSLASIYGAKPVGPGPLPLDAGAFATPELKAMVHSTVLEGCVNETLAALEARSAHELAGPQAVREALRAIERQESDHASLAFRFVSWALQAGGPDVRDAARSAFQLAEGQIRRALPADAHPIELERVFALHGRLSQRQRHELRQRALSEVISPSARALLAAG